MTRFRLLALFASLFLLLGGAVACGGDDDDDGGGDSTADETDDSEGDNGGDDGGDGDLEAYFNDLEALFTGLDESSASVEEDFPDAFVSLADTQGYYEDILPLFDVWIDGIDELEAPGEVEDEHDALSDAANHFAEEVGRLNDDLQELETDDEFQEYGEALDQDQAFNDAVQGVQDACVALQDIADEADITVDLQCGDTGDDEDDSGELTLEEYFTEVDAIFEEADSATDDAQAELETLPDTASLDEKKEAIDTFLSNIIDIFRTAEQSLQDLVVPVEAGQPNSDFMSAIDDAADLAEDLQEQAADALTQAELDDLVNAFDVDVSAATADADAACLELQALATSNNIDVDLDCED